MPLRIPRVGVASYWQKRVEKDRPEKLLQDIANSLIFLGKTDPCNQLPGDANLEHFPCFPGMYVIRVDALGFQPQEKAQLELTVASRSALNFALEGGQQFPTPIGQPAVGDTPGFSSHSVCA